MELKPLFSPTIVDPRLVKELPTLEFQETTLFVLPLTHIYFFFLFSSLLLLMKCPSLPKQDCTNTHSWPRFNLTVKLASNKLQIKHSFNMLFALNSLKKNLIFNILLRGFVKWTS